MAWLLGLLGTLKALCGFGQAVATDVGAAQQQNAGQAEQKAADDTAAIDAEQRINQAQAEPDDDKTTSGKLHDGTF